MTSTLPRPARALIGALALVFLAGAVAVHADLPPLIPRDVLFGNPERTAPQLSPDGKTPGLDRPGQEERPAGLGEDDRQGRRQDGHRRQEARHPAVLLGRGRHARCSTCRTSTATRTSTSTASTSTPATSATTRRSRACAPSVEGTDPDFPDEMLVPMNLRDRALFDVYRVDLSTGRGRRSTPRTRATWPGWGADAKFQVRGAQAQTPDGGTEIRVRDDVKSPWKTLLKVGPEEILELPRLHRRRQVGLPQVLDRQRHRARSSSADLATGAEKVIAVSAEVDAGDVADPPEDARRAGGLVRARAGRAGRCSTRP